MLKTITKAKWREVRLAAALLASVAGISVTFSRFNEIILDGRVVAKFEVERD